MRIYSRSEWGARPPSRAYNSLFPTAIIWHHTVAPGNGIMSFTQEVTAQRQMQNDHMDKRGYRDIGQHFTVYQTGDILEGTPVTAVGTHAAGANSYALGVEHQGNFVENVPTAAQWRSSVWLYAMLCMRFGIDPSRILGHRDVTATACPGHMAYELLNDFRSDVRNYDITETNIGDTEMAVVAPVPLTPANTWVVLPFYSNDASTVGGSKPLRYDAWVKMVGVPGGPPPKVTNLAIKVMADDANGRVSQHVLGDIEWEGSADPSFEAQIHIGGNLRKHKFASFYSGHVQFRTVTDCYVWINQDANVP